MFSLSLRQQSQAIRCLLLLFTFFILWLVCTELLATIDVKSQDKIEIPHSDGTVVIVVTATQRRPTRLADMTKLAQTLQHVRNLHWIVVEDGGDTVEAVEEILKRSGLFYVYLAARTPSGVTIKGGTQRNVALNFIRQHYHQQEAVVFFADEESSYDLRIFDSHIRKVQKIGVWAVGLAGSAHVVAPRVVDGKLTAWNVIHAPNRAFPVDLVGFAVNLREILRTKGLFKEDCVKSYKQSPETCFLLQFGLGWKELEPFGYDSKPMEILVWHTETRKKVSDGPTYGYVVEKE